MLVIARKPREAVLIKIKDAPIVPKSKKTEELDIVTLQKLAVIGRTFIDHPIAVMITSLEPGRINLGLDADMSVQFIRTSIDSLMGKGSQRNDT